MRAYWQTILIAFSLVVVVGAAASPSQADGHNGHRSYGGHGNRHGYGHDYGRSYGYGAGYRHAYGYGPGYGYSPGYGYGYGWGIGYGYSGGHDSSFGLSFSAPLYFGPRYYYPQPATILVPHTYGSPQPAGIAPTRSTCQQTREYQTEITIGEQVLPAYGTACLQADGSWNIISGPIVAE